MSSPTLCLSIGYSNSTADSAVTTSKFIDANKTLSLIQEPKSKRSTRKSVIDAKYTKLATSQKTVEPKILRRKTIK